MNSHVVISDGGNSYRSTASSLRALMQMHCHEFRKSKDCTGSISAHQGQVHRLLLTRVQHHKYGALLPVQAASCAYHKRRRTGGREGGMKGGGTRPQGKKNQNTMCSACEKILSWWLNCKLNSCENGDRGWDLLWIPASCTNPFKWSIVPMSIVAVSCFLDKASPCITTCTWRTEVFSLDGRYGISAEQRKRQSRKVPR